MSLALESPHESENIRFDLHDGFVDARHAPQAASPVPAPLEAPPHLQSPLPPSQRPVIDPDTTRVDRAALRAQVETLIRALPAVPAASASRRRELEGALEAIATLADSPLPEHRLGLQIRHAWAQAARSARKLARDLGTSWPWRQRQPELAHAYGALAALFVELKRTHLSAVAPHLMEDYAVREADNLAAAGVRTGKAGDVLNTGQGGSLSYTNGAWTAGGGSRGNELYLLDDDFDAYYVEMQNNHVAGAFGSEIGSWKTKAGLKWSINAGRELFEFADTKGLAKLVVNLRANRKRIDTAGPRARHVLDTFDGVKRAAAKALGKPYAPTAGAPVYLNDRKLAKGLDGTKIRLACEAFDQAAGNRNRSLSRWAETAYPAVERQVRVRLAEGKALPAEWLRAAVPVSDVYSGKTLGFRQRGFAVEAVAGTQTSHGGGQELGIGASLKLSSSRLQFFLFLAKAAHELLDVGFTQDPKAALEMHRQLDALSVDAHPQLKLYDEVRRELGQAPQERLQWSDEDRSFFGTPEEVPAQFHGDLATPDANRLERVTLACERLERRYLDFIAHAKALASEPDRFLPTATRRALDDARRTAFKWINGAVWGDGFPGGLQAALKDPGSFIAQTYDAMSLALGCAGTHLSMLHDRAAEHDAADLGVALRAADAAYRRARSVFDNAYLPMTRQTLTDGPASLRAESLFQRHDMAVTFSVSGGVKQGLVGQMLGAAPPALGSATVANSATQVTFSVDARYQIADVQPNAGRLGHYLQVTFSAQAGAPLAGQLMAQGVATALEKLFPGTQAHLIERRSADIAHQLQGVVFDVSEGASVVVRLRRAPGCRRFDLQYVQGLATRSGGLDVTLPVPTPVGLFNVGVNVSAAVQSTVFKLAGRDLGYQMQLWPRLEKLLQQTKGPDAKPLEKLFNADPELRDEYFGLPHTLLDVIERVLTLDAADPEQAALELAAGRAPSEFHRYAWDAPFARAEEVAGRARGTAPGAPAGATVPAPPELLLIEDDAVDTAKQVLRKLETVDERLAYFCGEGRPLFDAFVRVVGRAAEINRASTMHAGSAPHGFEIRLNDRLAPRG